MLAGRVGVGGRAGRNGEERKKYNDSKANQKQFSIFHQPHFKDLTNIHEIHSEKNLRKTAHEEVSQRATDKSTYSKQRPKKCVPKVAHLGNQISVLQCKQVPQLECPSDTKWHILEIRSLCFNANKFLNWNVPVTQSGTFWKSDLCASMQTSSSIGMSQ